MDYMRQQQSYSAGQSAVGFDAGLRAYMLRIYNYMAGALGLTGLVAYIVANVPAIYQVVFGTPLVYLFMFAPLVMVFVFASKIQTMALGTARAMFWSFAVLMGVSLASIFLAYTGASVARVFFISAAVFGSMSLVGYTTKRDLTGMGQFMMIGLIGVIIASVVNFFMESSALQFALSVLSVVIFVGLTAYDTQKLKNLYFSVGGNADLQERVSIQGALSLYMDFINLFISLMHLIGDRR